LLKKAGFFFRFREFAYHNYKFPEISRPTADNYIVAGKRLKVNRRRIKWE
jgi:hypothetical protein